MERRGWKPYDLWKALGGDGGPLHKQTVYSFISGVKGANGRRKASDVQATQLGHILDALEIDLTPRGKR